MIDATSSRVEFRLLGPLEVSLNGRGLTVAGARQRALLAYLLIHANQPVPTDRLLEELWDGNPPPSAAASLRVAVSKLRRVLQEAETPSAIATLPSAYLLRVEPQRMDVRRFESLVERGRSALREGEPERAAAELRQALGLWRGSPLAEFAYESFARDEIVRLEELHVSTLEDRVEADLELGRHADLVPELRLLAAEHPLRERLQAQLMLALYRAGRQQEALDVYRRTAEVLDEIGLEPGFALKQLERSVLAQDPALGGPGRISGLVSRAGTPTRWPVVSTLAVVGTLVAGLMLAFGRSSGEVPVSKLPQNTLVRLDAGNGQADAVFEVGASPAAITTSGDAVWVANFQDGTVSRVDLDDETVETRPSTTSAPTTLRVGAGAVWVASRFDGELVRVDPVTARPLVVITLAPGVGEIAVGPRDVWVSNGANGTVTRVDPRTNRISARVSGLAEPVGLATGNGKLWVAERTGNAIAVVDPRTNRVVDRLPLKFAPEQLALAGGVLWATHPLDNLVSRIDLVTRAVRVIQVGAVPSAVAASRDFAWVVNDIDHSISRIDAHTGIVDRTLVLSTNSMPPSRHTTPGGIATSRAGVWVSVRPY